MPSGYLETTEVQAGPLPHLRHISGKASTGILAPPSTLTSSLGPRQDFSLNIHIFQGQETAPKPSSPLKR